MSNPVDKRRERVLRAIAAYAAAHAGSAADLDPALEAAAVEVLRGKRRRRRPRKS
ncbi:MAG: hypothetical protein HY294_00010 [Candidatus Rokubacteria bacterium]|nr:hypothetical protein [Candidatus Rokubacteria bacterium]MBI3824362.1 hypothetical protein [Candidatus Rokubacteria bacterium]